MEKKSGLIIWLLQYLYFVLFSILLYFFVSYFLDFDFFKSKSKIYVFDYALVMNSYIEQEMDSIKKNGVIYIDDNNDIDQRIMAKTTAIQDKLSEFGRKGYLIIDKNSVLSFAKSDDLTEKIAKYFNIKLKNDVVKNKLKAPLEEKKENQTNLLDLD